MRRQALMLAGLPALLLAIPGGAQDSAWPSLGTVPERPSRTSPSVEASPSVPAFALTPIPSAPPQFAAMALPAAASRPAPPRLTPLPDSPESTAAALPAALPSPQHATLPADSILPAIRLAQAPGSDPAEPGTINAADARTIARTGRVDFTLLGEIEALPAESLARLAALLPAIENRPRAQVVVTAEGTASDAAEARRLAFRNGMLVIRALRDQGVSEPRIAFRALGLAGVERGDPRDGMVEIAISLDGG